MASPQTNITSIEEFRYSRRFQSRTSARENTTAIESDGARKPVESVTVPVDAELEMPTAGREDKLSTRRLTQSELYPVRHAFSAEHIAALRLLTLSIGRSGRALRHLEEGDLVSADVEIQKLQTLLPELFCCRALGDGFGTIVNALMSAFESLSGNTPNSNQINAVRRILEMLKDRPFLTADEADAQLPLLEESGLSPYPPELMTFLSSE